MNKRKLPSCLIVATVSTDESISMRLYRQNIFKVLQQFGSAVSVLQAGNITEPRIVSKMIEVVLRYIYYPLAILSSSASVVHITDHAYAFLIPFIHLAGKMSIVSLHNRPEDLLSDDMWERHKTQSLLPGISKILFTFSMRALPFANRIICITPSIYDSMIRAGVPEYRLHTIPPPISDIFFTKLTKYEKSYIRIKIKEKRKEFYILHPGNNDPAHKNIEHALRCVSFLRSHQIPVRLIKAGDPFTAGQRQLIEREHIAGAVTHLGILSQPELRLVYHYCDALLFPSYYEGCPAPPWEALASGLGIIVSDIPAHRDHFTDYALFIPPDNYKKSASIIERLCKHPAILRHKTGIGKKAATRMKSGAISDALYRLYANIDWKKA